MDETRDNTSDGGHPSIRLAPIDHDEYDALADLFLGDGALAPEPTDEESILDGAERPGHGTHTPVLQLTHSGVEAEGFESGELGVLESLEATGVHATSLLEELLEEGGTDATGPVDEGVEFVRLPRAQVEVIVLGHLPVRATLWARQYACSSAKSNEEVVALVRAASGSTAIDLITGREPERALGCADMESALGTIHERADRVILRVDERIEPELFDRPEVGVITILTGADEAAVVASYRLVKTIDASLRDRYEDIEDAPRVRIAVMGSSAEQAGDAQEKLRKAVESFLEREVEIVIGSGRIDATGTTNIFRDTCSHHAGDLVDGLVELAHRKERSENVAVEAELEPGVIESRSVDANEIAARPKQASEKQSRDPDIRDGLCALLDGLRAIETRCPKAQGVEFGVDGDGRLHAIACDADCYEALERLYVAQSWAREHFDLLVRVEPELWLPSVDPRDESDAVMHLISHEPASLKGVYDTPVRMYALARVRVGGVIAQVATPLN
jgi:hypothetical protein